MDESRVNFSSNDPSLGEVLCTFTHNPKQDNTLIDVNGKTIKTKDPKNVIHVGQGCEAV